MAVLVTGATGFVGSWLARKLSEQGEEVRVLHRPKSSLEDLKGVRFTSCLGDVTDAISLKSACKGVDTVFHLAGVVGYSKKLRPMMEAVNVGGTKNVLDAINPAQKLVYMSSVVAIGASFKPEVLNEESPFTIHHLDLSYFETKRAAEKLVVEACSKNQAQAVILNPSTIYGATDAKKGSRKTQVKVAKGKFPFYTSGGASIVSVHDVVDAIISARTKGRNGERYILCGENLTIKDMLTRIAQLAGVEPPAHYLPNFAVHAIGRVGDIMEKMGKKGPLTSENAWTSTMYHWFDHSKATRELGFNPRPAQEAFAESVNWMKQNGILN